MLNVDYIVNSFFDSITWLLSDEGGSRVWLVDCGDIEPIIDKIGGKSIAGVLLTHAHFDHIYGLPELLKRYPDCRIYTNEVGRETLGNAKLNMSLYHETPLTVEGPQISICGEGDDIELFSISSQYGKFIKHYPTKTQMTSVCTPKRLPPIFTKTTTKITIHSFIRFPAEKHIKRYNHI